MSVLSGGAEPPREPYGIPDTAHGGALSAFCDDLTFCEPLSFDAVDSELSLPNVKRSFWSVSKTARRMEGHPDLPPQNPQMSATGSRKAPAALVNDRGFSTRSVVPLSVGSSSVSSNTSSIFLLLDTDVAVASHLNAKHIEVGIGRFDHWFDSTVQSDDLDHWKICRVRQ
jgi:hypothetical protein